MKTITPFELQMPIDKRYVELIDGPPEERFKKIHALVARAIHNRWHAARVAECH